MSQKTNVLKTSTTIGMSGGPQKAEQLYPESVTGRLRTRWIMCRPKVRCGSFKSFRFPRSRAPQLGRPSRIPASPAEAVLDRVANPHPDTNYLARFTAPEFTVLCPVTGQPDF